MGEEERGRVVMKEERKMMGLNEGEGREKENERE